MTITISPPVSLSATGGDQSFVSGIQYLLDGNFVVAYDDTSDNRAIYAQIFAPNGAVLGDPIFVAAPAADQPDGSDYSNTPIVTTLAWGGFAVMWADRSRTDVEVFARIFQADGTPATDIITMGPLDGALSDAVLNIDATFWGTGFNAVWDAYDIGATSSDRNTDVYNQRVDADGTVPADIWNVNGGGPAFQGEAHIETLLSNFVNRQNGLAIGYVDESTGNSNFNVILYDRDGNFLSTTTWVSRDYQIRYTDLAALTNGGFVLSWADSNGTGLDPKARIVRPDGYTDEFFLLPASTNEGVTSIDLHAVGGGGFVMSYTETLEISPTFSVTTVNLQLFDDFGVPNGGPVEVARGENIRHWETEVTTLLDGQIAVAWNEADVFEFDAFVSVVDLGSPALFGECIGTLIGTTENDTLDGDDCDNTLNGLDGNDLLRGDGGNDTLNGGDGADTLNGGEGDDTIIGGETDEDRRDVVYAGAGNDNVDAGHGNDLVYGQDGDDIIAGGFGADELQGQDGDDTITGSAFSDLVFGGDGDDFVNGGFGFDRINGGLGADKFFHAGAAGHGSDWIQDYSAAEGDVLHFGGSARASDFVVRFAHTASAGGERSGNDGVEEAFVNYRGQTLWALVDGGNETSINVQIGGSVFDLLA